jgi:hypothetical protein
VPAGDALHALAGVDPLLGDDRLLVGAGHLCRQRQNQNVEVERGQGSGSGPGLTEQRMPSTESATQ